MSTTHILAETHQNATETGPELPEIGHQSVHHPLKPPLYLLQISRGEQPGGMTPALWEALLLAMADITPEERLSWCMGPDARDILEDWRETRLGERWGTDLLISEDMPAELRAALQEGMACKTRAERTAWRRKHEAPNPAYLAGYWYAMNAEPEPANDVTEENPADVEGNTVPAEAEPGVNPDSATAPPCVLLLNDKFSRIGAPAGIITMAKALTRRFGTDAHMQVAISGRPIRLKTANIGTDPITIGWLVFDIDDPIAHAESMPAGSEWRQTTRAKLAALNDVHPRMLAYSTRGGFRIVYRLSTPVTIADKNDAEIWKRRYRAACDYLELQFGLTADKQCCDFTRLYRLPKVNRDGEKQQPEIIGDANAIGVFDLPADPGKEGEKRAKQAAKAEKRKAETSTLPKLYQKGPAFWVDRGDGTLSGPHASAEIGAVLCEDHGVRDRALVKIAQHEHTHVVSDIFASYLAPATKFRPELGERGKIEIATLRWPAITPQYHADIDGWLSLLGGTLEGAAVLRAWIAALWDLDRPAPLLLATGPAQIGKDLLISCCASVYGAAAIDAAEALGDFNAKLKDCPLVSMNEGPPKGMTLSDLRRWITNSTWRLNEKFQVAFDLNSYIRVMSCMNNSSGFPFLQKGDLTGPDVDAVASRFAWIEAQPDEIGADGQPIPSSSPSARYLANIEHSELKAWASSKFREHAAWLRESRERDDSPCARAAKNERMAAPPYRGATIVRRMAVAGNTEQVEQIVTWLETGVEPDEAAPNTLIVYQEKVWAVHDWLTARTCTTIAVPGEVGSARPRGFQVGRPRYRQLNLEALRQIKPDADWAQIEATIVHKIAKKKQAS